MAAKMGNHSSRGPFDGKYVQALYDFGVAAGENGAACDDALPDLLLRRSTGIRPAGATWIFETSVIW
jgi:hypothetical protein